MSMPDASADRPLSTGRQSRSSTEIGVSIRPSSAIDVIVAASISRSTLGRRCPFHESEPRPRVVGRHVVAAGDLGHGVGRDRRRATPPDRARSTTTSSTSERSVAVEQRRLCGGVERRPVGHQVVESAEHAPADEGCGDESLPEEDLSVTRRQRLDRAVESTDDHEPVVAEFPAALIGEDVRHQLAAAPVSRDREPQIGELVDMALARSCRDMNTPHERRIGERAVQPYGTAPSDRGDRALGQQRRHVDHPVLET